MTLRSLSATAAAVAALAIGAQAIAQPKPAAPAAAAPAPAAQAPAIVHGPVPAGICIFSFDRAAANSLVGKAVAARLTTIGQQVTAELEGEQNAIEADAKALEAAKATLDQGALEKRAADLQVRDRSLQRKAQQRNNEMQATQQKQFGRISQELNPAVAAVYQSRQCGVLLQREAVAVANPAADITDAVIQVLNTRIQTLTFDRERLDQAAMPPAQR